MIYPASFESKIGFDKIRTLIREKCSGPLSMEEADAMSFSDDYEVVRKMLCETSEMLSIIRGSRELPLRDVGDAASSLREIKTEGSYMSAQRVYGLLGVLEQSFQVASFFRKSCKDGAEDGSDRSTSTIYPYLSEIASELESFPELITEINRCVNKFGEVKDTASDALYEIRRSMRAASGSMSKTMRSVLDRAIAAGIVEKDVSPSVRDGRLVIPVESGKKRSIAGIVHDASSSGKTVFIEPLEVVEAGNRLRELEMDAKREEIEVLKSLAGVIRPRAREISRTCLILAKLDFIHAKAMFAVEVDGRLPNLCNERMIEWYHAVHPQLLISLKAQGKDVVPLSLSLDDKNRILIISGPNAGGKSVCLKTVGIVQYMTQCGLLPTVYENSHVGIFRNLFVDIGDEQSIENDLSTYSSHLKNMKFFLQHASRNTLLLADEMGSGTEPQIGGALAQAILEKLSQSRCLGIITTHYQNLKTFAGETEGFINGAMLYDRQHLSPTFQLSVGSPGSSFAVEIARKIGLDAEVISKAQDIVGSDYVNLDKYLLDVARDKRYWAMKRQNIREKASRLDNLLSLYEDKADDLKSQRREIIHDARMEAKGILAEANSKIEKVIREIREAQADKERTREIRREFDSFKSGLLDDDSKMESTPEILKDLRHKSRKKKEDGRGRQTKASSFSHKGSAEPASGDFVKMKDGNVVGQIVRVEGKKAEVAFGSLRTQVELSRLVVTPKPKASSVSETQGLGKATLDASRERQLQFKPEIDLRGMRGDEAVQAVVYFLDDAVQFSATRLRILHGTGSGILKTLIRRQLDATPFVKSYRDEDVRFGGAGITVVELE